MNILDIAVNSIKAEAKNITIVLNEDDEVFEFSVSDDGCGISKELLEKVTDPFTSVSETQNSGLGIPFLRIAAEKTGGNISISSQLGAGTCTKAVFYKKHVDFTPLGDVISTVVTLVCGGPETDIVFSHTIKGEKEGRVYISTKEMREVLGDIRLNEPVVLEWIKGYLLEQYGALTQRG